MAPVKGVKETPGLSLHDQQCNSNPSLDSQWLQLEPTSPNFNLICPFRRSPAF